jgi:hypothetical protein
MIALSFILVLTFCAQDWITSGHPFTPARGLLKAFANPSAWVVATTQLRWKGVSAL